MIDLDHIALATRDVTPALDVLVGEWGGLVLFGGNSSGFRPMQVRLGDDEQGMNVELLEPWNVEANDFLARFLDRHGDGPHHMTFKVDDLEAALHRVRASGFQPVGIDLRDTEWKEAFLHPREAHGTVVQLAEAHHEFPARAELLAHVRKHGPNGHPKWWPDPPPPGAERGFLRRVVVATPSLSATLGFFAGILGGQEIAAGEGWVELTWPGAARVKLEDRPGRRPGVARIEVDIMGADGDADDGHGEVVVAGTRVLLSPRSSV